MSEQQTMVVDSWVWIEYFSSSQKGEKAATYIQNPQNILLTSTVGLAEVVSKYRRKNEDPAPAVTAMLTISSIISADAEIARLAGEIHAAARKKIKDFGLADAFQLATARLHKAKLITGDLHFKGYPETILI